MRKYSIAKKGMEDNCFQLKCFQIKTFNNRDTLPQLIVPGGRVLTNGLVDLGSIPGRVISKTLKIVFDTSLLNT